MEGGDRNFFNSDALPWNTNYQATPVIDNWPNFNNEFESPEQRFNQPLNSFNVYSPHNNLEQTVENVNGNSINNLRDNYSTQLQDLSNINYQLQFNQGDTSHLVNQNQTIPVNQNVEHVCRVGNQETVLVKIEEVSEKYRSVFSEYSYFNAVQSKVFKDVYLSDRSIAVCAPTGAGKTVILELAIIRFLEKSFGDYRESKVVYMAPLKALCTEKLNEWRSKFSPFGVKCIELTGDSELEDLRELNSSCIIMTTPEKWDSMTRKFKTHYNSLINSIQLFLVDEVHLINDEERGATLEAVVSRMRTLRKESIRFIAVSATVPNVEDVAKWLGNEEEPGVFFMMDGDFRPVELDTQVIGYYCPDSYNEYRFDLNLNYKLLEVIKKYWNGKPTLVFCATRKNTFDAAKILAETTTFINKNSNIYPSLVKLSGCLKDQKLREIILSGIAVHHAGIDPSDRHLIEEEFRNGHIPVLLCTSTLAMGINLPANLVVIKSTCYYDHGSGSVPYSESTILQMTGRAGRPQFGDSSACAVIMTKNQLVSSFQKLLKGEKLLESNLHKNLTEHLNAEIVLGTITDAKIAVGWIRSTFLFQRIMKNKKYYGFDEKMDENAIEKRIEGWCIKELSGLRKFGMIEVGEGFNNIRPLKLGELMAHYCISFETMKKFNQIATSATLSSLVDLISSCSEFIKDISLRQNEKKQLFSYSDIKKRNKEEVQIIRFPLPTKIKTAEMKVNTLLQASFGNFKIDNNFTPDINKILRTGKRISKCLMDVLLVANKGYRTVVNGIILHKCFTANLWENSVFITKQFNGVGVALSQAIAKCGLTSFDALEIACPRSIEMHTGRHAPFGNQVVQNAKNIPKYEVSLKQNSATELEAQLCISILIANYRNIPKTSRHTSYLVVGDCENTLLFYQKLYEPHIIKNQGQFARTFHFKKPKIGHTLHISLISESLVGIDFMSTYEVNFNYSSSCTNIEPKDETRTEAVSTSRGESVKENHKRKSSQGPDGDNTCKHNCKDKTSCSHQCCKSGRKSEPRPKPTGNSQPKKRKTTQPLIDLIQEKNSTNILNSPMAFGGQVINSPRLTVPTEKPQITEDFPEWDSNDNLDYSGLWEPKNEFLSSANEIKFPKNNFSKYFSKN